MQAFIQDNLIIVITGIFVSSVALGLLAQSMAMDKGYGKQWFWAGCLLPFIGIIWVAGLPDNKLREELRQLKLPVSEPVQEAKQQAAEQQDEGEFAAVIAATLASLQSSAGKRYVLRSFRKAAGPTAWARASRYKA